MRRKKENCRGKNHKMKKNGITVEKNKIKNYKSKH